MYGISIYTMGKTFCINKISKLKKTSVVSNHLHGKLFDMQLKKKKKGKSYAKTRTQSDLYSSKESQGIYSCNERRTILRGCM